MLYVYNIYIYIIHIYQILYSYHPLGQQELSHSHSRHGAMAKDSRFFDMKWAPAAAMDHDNLLPGQAAESGPHVSKGEELTRPLHRVIDLGKP